MTDVQSEARRIVGDSVMVLDAHWRPAGEAAAALGVPFMDLLFAMSRRAAEVLAAVPEADLRGRAGQLHQQLADASRRERSANGFGFGHRVGNHTRLSRRIGKGDQAKVKRIQGEIKAFRKELEVLEQELKRRAHA